MRYPHCKSCWWWKRIPSIIAKTDIGICYYWRNKSKESDYCPDHFNRREGNKERKLEDWINEHKERLSLDDLV